jgi:hypothetical protein
MNLQEMKEMWDGKIQKNWNESFAISGSEDGKILIYYSRENKTFFSIVTWKWEKLIKSLNLEP